MNIKYEIICWTLGNIIMDSLKRNSIYRLKKRSYISLVVYRTVGWFVSSVTLFSWHTQNKDVWLRKKETYMHVGRRTT
jgi:hypothetical protein